MGVFSHDLGLKVGKLLDRVNDNCYSIARECFWLTVEYSPSSVIGSEYAEGHLKNQWYPSNGSSFSQSMNGVYSQSGADSIERVKTFNGSEFTGKDGSVTFANNLPYAYRVEKIGWPAPKWNNTPPYAMVQKAVVQTANNNR